MVSLYTVHYNRFISSPVNRYKYNLESYLFSIICATDLKGRCTISFLSNLRNNFGLVDDKTGKK